MPVCAMGAFVPLPIARSVEVVPCLTMRKRSLATYVLTVLAVLAILNAATAMFSGAARAHSLAVFSGGAMVGMLAMWIGTRVYR
jgi:hypothetical protein